MWIQHTVIFFSGGSTEQAKMAAIVLVMTDLLWVIDDDDESLWKNNYERETHWPAVEGLYNRNYNDTFANEWSGIPLNADGRLAKG